MSDDSPDTDEFRQVFLGMAPIDDGDGHSTVGADATREQLAELREYDLAVRSEDGDPVPWDAIDDTDRPDSICQHVVIDREQRVDDGTIMADRPPVVIFTIDEDEDEIVRVEYYWGHDRLGLEHDLRADPDADPDPTLDRGRND
jgi:hypothetical protein